MFRTKQIWIISIWRLFACFIYSLLFCYFFALFLNFFHFVLILFVWNPEFKLHAHPFSSLARKLVFLFLLEFDKKFIDRCFKFNGNKFSRQFYILYLISRICFRTISLILLLLCIFPKPVGSWTTPLLNPKCFIISIFISFPFFCFLIYSSYQFQLTLI